MDVGAVRHGDPRLPKPDDEDTRGGESKLRRTQKASVDADDDSDWD